MTDEELRQLKKDYGVELFDFIIKAFSNYDLDFKWRSGWGSSEYPVWINSKGIVEFWIQGHNEEVLAEMDESDCEAFSKFLSDVIKNFIDIYSHKPPFDKLKSKIVADEIEVYLDEAYDWVQGGVDDIPIIAIEVWFDISAKE